MKKLSQKTVCLIIALLMVFSSFPITASAAYKTTENGEYRYSVLYTKDDTEYIELTKYCGSATDVTVPAEIDSMKVMTLGSTFASNKNVKSVTVGDGIDGIVDSAFYGCNGLTVTLPQSVKFIGKGSFKNAKIKEIRFSQGLQAIESFAFENAQIESKDFVLPDSLEYIDTFAFQDAKFGNVKIGKSAQIVSLGEYSPGVEIVGFPFVGDDDIQNPFVNASVASVTVDDENTFLSADGNALYNKNKSILYSYLNSDGASFTMPESVEKIARSAFEGVKLDKIVLNSGNLKSITPSAFTSVKASEIEMGDSCGVKTIEWAAFYGSQIDKILISTGVEEIKGNAFSKSTVKSVVFANGSHCKTIRENAFSECSNIENIEIPSSVSVIETHAFLQCKNLKNVVFEDNSALTVLPYRVFGDCSNITTVDFGQNSSLESLDESFSESKYYYHRLKSVDFSGCVNLSEIRSGAFTDCTLLKSIDLSNTEISSVTSGLFENCTALSEVNLPDTAYEIQEAAFAECSSLEKINTENIVKIGKNAFYNCNGIQSVPVSSDEKQLDGIGYYETESKVFISSYDGSSKDVVIPDYINSKPVTRILDGAFNGNKINSVSFPSTLEFIGNNAFESCGLKSISTLSDGITYIGKSAFAGNRNLKGTLTLPKNLRQISSSAFANCGFTKIVFNDNLKHINKNAFKFNKCESFDIPDGVVSIGENALFNEPLKKVTFGNGIDDIESVIKSNFTAKYDDFYHVDPESAVYVENFSVPADCKNYSTRDGVLYNKDGSRLICFPQGKTVDTFTVPSSVTEIAEQAFYYTQGLKNVVIPKTVKSIGNYAFAYSYGLESVLFKSGVNLDCLYLTFFECRSLKNVRFEDNVNINRLISAFNTCISLESVDLDCNAEYIGEIFYNCTNLKNVVLHEGIVYIDSGSFRKTALEKVVVPKTVTAIGDNAYSYCSRLKYINLSNVKSLADRAFYGCTSLESIDLTYVLYYEKSKGDTATFGNCPNLKKFYFTQDERTAYIAENEYSNNDSLETIVVGNGIGEIRDRAFANCSNLKTAYIADSVDDIADTAFDNCDMLTIVCVLNSPVMYYAERNNIPYETFAVAPIADQEYTGKEITPTLNVKQNDRELQVDKDYSARYTDNVNIGTAKVSIVGIGDYSIFGTVAKFKIVGGQNSSEPQPDNSINNNSEKSLNGNADKSNTKAVTADNNAVSDTANSEKPRDGNGKGSASTPQSSQSRNEVNGNVDSNGKSASDTSDKSSDNGGVVNENQEAPESKTSPPDENTDLSDDNSNNTSDGEKDFFEKIIAAVVSFFENIIAIIKSWL